MERDDDIKFMIPSFSMCLGQPNQGKTYFTRHLVEILLKKGFEIYYVVNRAFTVEEELGEQAVDEENVYILKAKDLSEQTLDNIIAKLTKNDKPKLVIYDNFTYQISKPFLNMCTFARKYNASTLFISHTIFADAKIGPRIREAVNYFIFFYIPKSDSYRKFIGKEMYDEVYLPEIKSREFRFLLIDLKDSKYTVNKLPEFKFNFEIIDQAPKTEVGKMLRDMDEAERKLKEQAKSGNTNNINEPPEQPKPKPKPKKNEPMPLNRNRSRKNNVISLQSVNDLRAGDAVNQPDPVPYQRKPTGTRTRKRR